MRASVQQSTVNLNVPGFSPLPMVVPEPDAPLLRLGANHRFRSRIDCRVRHRVHKRDGGCVLQEEAPRSESQWRVWEPAWDHLRDDRITSGARSEGYEIGHEFYRTDPGTRSRRCAVPRNRNVDSLLPSASWAVKGNYMRLRVSRYPSIRESVPGQDSHIPIGDKLGTDQSIQLCCSAKGQLPNEIRLACRRLFPELPPA